MHYTECVISYSCRLAGAGNAVSTASLLLLPPQLLLSPQLLLLLQWDALSCAHCIVMEVATTAAFFVSFWYW
jgi:hypothetical protein